MVDVKRLVEDGLRIGAVRSEREQEADMDALGLPTGAHPDVTEGPRQRRSFGRRRYEGYEYDFHSVPTGVKRRQW